MNRKSKGYAKGGRKQGYADRLDESLGSKDGAESTKSQSMKSRRYESESMHGISDSLSGFKNTGTMKNNWD